MPPDPGVSIKLHMWKEIAGNENLEIQWKLATLSEAKAVVTQYHKYLSENSLIKSIPRPFRIVTSTPSGLIATGADFLCRIYGHLTRGVADVVPLF